MPAEANRDSAVGDVSGRQFAGPMMSQGYSVPQALACRVRVTVRAAVCSHMHQPTFLAGGRQQGKAPAAATRDFPLHCGRERLQQVPATRKSSSGEETV